MEYTASRLRKGISPDTARAIRESLRSLAESAGNPPAASLTAEHVERWLEGQRARVKPGTVRTRFVHVRVFARWLVAQRYAKAEATAGVDLPRKPRYVPRPVADDDVATVMAAVPDERAQLVLSLMAQEGLRRMEVSGLDLADVDFAARSMIIAGKGGHERHVPITDETWELLHHYLRAHPAKSGPLIRSYKRPGHRLSRETIGAYVAQWSRGAGVNASGHQYRHSAGTAVLRGSGGNLRVAQDFLGHSSPSSTAVYTLVETSDLRAAMAGRSFLRPVAPHPPPADEEGGGLRLVA